MRFFSRQSIKPKKDIHKCGIFALFKLSLRRYNRTVKRGRCATWLKTTMFWYNSPKSVVLNGNTNDWFLPTEGVESNETVSNFVQPNASRSRRTCRHGAKSRSQCPVNRQRQINTLLLRTMSKLDSAKYYPACLVSLKTTSFRFIAPALTIGSAINKNRTYCKKT